MTALTDGEVAAALAELDGWTGDGGGIRRSVEAPSFLAGLDIVQKVGRAAEAANHHPDIDIRWRTVTFTLTTHDAGGRVSGLDVDMARTIDATGSVLAPLKPRSGQVRFDDVPSDDWMAMAKETARMQIIRKLSGPASRT